MSFELPLLNYNTNSLEPYIDTKTMEIHHGKHHAGYTNNLNNAIKGTDLENSSIEDILTGLDLNNSAVRNNGGGYFNHSLFWNVMSPSGGGEPSGELATAIKSSFGSFEEFKAIFSKAAGTRFGSGWAWLCVHKGGKLEVCSTANQDNPLMNGIGCGGYPILGLDVWEHAYYLNYQNRRPDYVSGFFNVINWEAVSKSFNEKV
ncbi:superoxide dismutase [Flavobacteriaceae bacterium]|nr:superoxide dismutase [Flavobacteriaceae bacterium]